MLSLVILYCYNGPEPCWNHWSHLNISVPEHISIVHMHLSIVQHQHRAPHTHKHLCWKKIKGETLNNHILQVKWYFRCKHVYLHILTTGLIYRVFGKEVVSCDYRKITIAWHVMSLCVSIYWQSAWLSLVESDGENANAKMAAQYWDQIRSVDAFIWSSSVGPHIEHLGEYFIRWPLQPILLEKLYTLWSISPDFVFGVDMYLNPQSAGVFELVQ